MEARARSCAHTHCRNQGHLRHSLTQPSPDLSPHWILMPHDAGGAARKTSQGFESCQGRVCDPHIQGEQGDGALELRWMCIGQQAGPGTLGEQASRVAKPRVGANPVVTVPFSTQAGVTAVSCTPYSPSLANLWGNRGVPLVEKQAPGDEAAPGASLGCRGYFGVQRGVGLPRHGAPCTGLHACAHSPVASPVFGETPLHYRTGAGREALPSPALGGIWHGWLLRWVRPCECQCPRAQRHAARLPPRPARADSGPCSARQRGTALGWGAGPLLSARCQMRQRTHRGVTSDCDQRGGLGTSCMQTKSFFWSHII